MSVFYLFILFCMVTLFFLIVVELEKHNFSSRLNNEAIIEGILRLEPKIRDLQFLIRLLQDPTKKGQGPKIASRESHKKKDKKSSNGARTLKHLMGQRSNKEVVIGDWLSMI